LFLLSDESVYIIGAEVTIDGGASLYMAYVAAYLQYAQ
jgi:hypothetical protein